MKKVVIFTEGQGELIFIRELLIRTIDNNDLSFECFELKADKHLSFPYKQNTPNAKIHFTIINVGNDEKVLSEIRNRSEWYTSRGVEIIGVRDLYSETYKKLSDRIDQLVIKKFQDSTQNIINQIVDKEKIHFFFAIMELEAWFLAMYKIFERIDPSLTSDNIRHQLKYNLEMDNPENSYFHPAIQLEEILGLAGKNYDKHRSEVSSIVSHITSEDVYGVIGDGFCNSFVQLHNEIQREYIESQNAVI